MDRETRLELIDTGWEEAERLNRLVGNLLDMSRLEAGAIHLNCEDGDIEDVIGSALLRMHSRLQKHSIRTSVPENRPLAKIDFVLLEQVLINLLDNAAKYSPPGSEIEVGVEPDAQFLQVWVTDRGRGIPPADLERIFEKFYRIDRPDGIHGTGLGLSICKGIVEAHGGRIWAENRPEGGTRISFRLSAVPEPLRLVGEE
jgi:two-component system sensor histidine kinase KdpD